MGQVYKSSYISMFFLALLAWGKAFASPVVAPSDFSNWFYSHLRANLPIPTQVGLKAARYQYFFIGGFLGEGIPGYFRDNAKELHYLGVPSRNIHRFYPSSALSIDHNAAKLKQAVLATVQREGEKVVIIAQSRGAVDALAFALSNGYFVRDSVEAIFLVQGALRGSGLADFFEGEGHVIDRRMPEPYRSLGRALGKAKGFLGSRLNIHEGLVGLTHRNSAAYWERSLERNRASLPYLDGKVFYVRSWEDPRRMAPILRTGGWYLQSYYGVNDGEVALEDQYLPEVGVTLAIVESDHAGLTVPFPVSNTKERFRRSLSRAIFMAVGQPEALP